VCEKQQPTTYFILGIITSCVFQILYIKEPSLDSPVPQCSVD